MNPNPPLPPVEYRFTRENAAFYGARGAAERERRFHERHMPADEPKHYTQAEVRRILRAADYLLDVAGGKREGTAARVAEALRMFPRGSCPRSPAN